MAPPQHWSLVLVPGRRPKHLWLFEGNALVAAVVQAKEEKYWTTIAKGGEVTHQPFSQEDVDWQKDQTNICIDKFLVQKAGM